MTAAWAIPVGVLAGLSGLMFVFIWWWFPRHYRKGVEMDMAEVDEARREREAYAARQGSTTADEAALPQPPRQHVYQPQAYTSY